MNGQKSNTKINNIIFFLYISLYFIIGLTLVFSQPFGNPPDEYNRFLIPQYIAQNGTLPNGYDEAIRIGGYGFSYGFQPILPYIVQGYAMRLAGFFTSSADALLYTARMVNFLFGLITAVFTLFLGKEWFSDRRFMWLFAFLATFLPQSIFLHTYVNTDSCCMMSIAIMLYGLTRGIRSCFSVSSCLLLSAGIIFCALSYYNAYGYILSCILLFSAYCLSLKNGKLFLQKGLLISTIVLLGIGWWFIRSGLLYDGDILGLKARDICGSMYALPQFHPDTRVTWQSRGCSLWDMLVQSDFINLTTLSFIGIYGPMTIVTSIWIYRFYKVFFAVGILLCITLSAADFFSRKSGQKAAKNLFPECSPGFRIFYHANMIFCIAMPCILSLYYSFTTDFQPQGRYVLPILLPLAYYCVRGLQKGFTLLESVFAKKEPAKKLLSRFFKGYGRFLAGICIFFILCIIVSLFVTVYGYAIPYYIQNPIAP